MSSVFNWESMKCLHCWGNMVKFPVRLLHYDYVTLLHVLIILQIDL